MLKTISISATLLGFALFEAASASAHAQNTDPSTTRTLRTIGSFFSPGGYFLTSSSGKAALGSQKFYNELGFFSRPKEIGSGVKFQWGGEWLSGGDKFLPFTGSDNYFNLLGPSVRFSRDFKEGLIRPYVDFGLYYGQVRSQKLGFDRSAFTPSIALGVSFKIGRYFRLSTDYRLTQQINGVDTSGFAVNLRVN